MSITGEMLNGVTYWLSRRERQQEKDDAAIRSVLTALNSTKAYLALKESGEPADREKESGLVRLWEDAAVHIRRTDPSLASRLQQKAEYWAAPKYWAADEETERRIQIDEIAREARRLLQIS